MSVFASCWWWCSSSPPPTPDRFRDEYLNEHWFTSLAHAQVLVEGWRREYNEERPKKGLGGLTPAHYAKRLSSSGRSSRTPDATSWSRSAASSTRGVPISRLPTGSP